MSLSLAYDIAKGGLSTSSGATAVVTRNIQNVDHPYAARKSAQITSAIGGGARISGIAAAVDSALMERALANGSALAWSGAIKDGLDGLQNAGGVDAALNTSPAAMLASLATSLQVAAGAPNDEVAARAAVAAASEVARTLNAAAAATSQVRADADAGIAEAVASLNRLLADFGDANAAVVEGTLTGRDVTDSIDRRTEILNHIAELVDVRASIRGANDMVLFAGDGVTLFETVPRSVTVQSGGLMTGVAGGDVTIDGVAFGLARADRLGGKIGGLFAVRDDYAVTFGRQLDEIARGLITAFAERDRSASGLPDLAGLFTYAGGPGLPAAGSVVDGLAAELRVNANVDPQQGGDVWLLRDGAISAPGNAAYTYNSAGGAGFSARLRELGDALLVTQPFDGAAGLTASAGLLEFASDSVGWIGQARQTVASTYEDRAVLAERSLAAWQSRVGINLDDELATLIALERSYQASARLITTVNSMFDALLSATG